MRPTRPLEHASHIDTRRRELQAVVDRILASASTFVWEVGCGHGHFLTAYAKSNPTSLCIGVDISSDRIARANRKRDRAGLGSLHFLRADAEDFLAVLPPAARFTSIFVLFPDPWPKRRHHKNRVLSAEFLTHIALKCPKGTPLYFRTDHEPYFQEVVRTVDSHPDWKHSETATLPLEEPTVFEKRARSHFTLVATRE